MNYSLTAAAALMIIIGVVHSFLGEHLIVKPLLTLNLPHIKGSDFITKRTLRFAWHLTTLAVFGLAGVVLIYAGTVVDSSGALILNLIASIFFMASVISLLAIRGKHFSWWVFLMIGGLIAFS
jgi:hypothetical protein